MGTHDTNRPNRSGLKRGLALMLAAGSLAVPASAAADAGYSSVNALTGGGDPDGNGYSSVTAITGGSGEQTQAVANPLPAPDTLLAQRGETAGAGASDYSSLAAIAGPPSSPALATSSSAAADSFDWGDALIGGALATLLTLLALAGARTAARHRRTTAHARP